MLSKASVILLAQALPAILAAPYDGNTWGAYFWTGEACTGAESGAYTGPDKPQEGKYCAAIPDIGGTQSVDFHAADDRYIFGLHQRDDCSDDGNFSMPTNLRGLTLINGFKVASSRVNHIFFEEFLHPQWSPIS